MHSQLRPAKPLRPARPAKIQPPVGYIAPSREGKKGVTFYLDPHAMRQLRLLGLDLDLPLSRLMLEATNLLFKKHRQPEIA